MHYSGNGCPCAESGEHSSANGSRASGFGQPHGIARRYTLRLAHGDTCADGEHDPL